MFSWLWGNSDALNYCSCPSGSCVILGGCEGTTAGLRTLVAAEPWSRALPTGSSSPGCRLSWEGSGGARGSPASLGTVSGLPMCPGAHLLQGQARPSRTMTIAFEASSFERGRRAWGWPGGCGQCPHQLRGDRIPPAALWTTQHDQANGVSGSPSASTPNHYLPGVPTPVGASLCSPSPPSFACTEGLVHFLPRLTWCLTHRLPHGTQSPGITTPALQRTAQGAGWGASPLPRLLPSSRHPASVSQSAGHCTMLRCVPEGGRNKLAITWVGPGSAPGTPRS